MFTPKTVLGFLERDTMLKLLFFVLLYSILPLAEIVLLVYLGDITGNYLILAVAASTGFVGVFVAFGQLRTTTLRLKAKVAAGQYPGAEFLSIAGVLVGAMFLLSPGFITDLAGLLLFVPAVRNGVGGLIIRKLRVNMKETYEYLRLYDYDSQGE